MSVSQWLKLPMIGTVEGQDEAAFRDRLMLQGLFAATATEGLLLVHADKDLRPRVKVALGIDRGQASSTPDYCTGSAACGIT